MIHRAARLFELARLSGRSFVAVVAFVAFVPTLVIVGWLSIQSARSEQAQLEASAAKKAVEIAAAVDRAVVNLKNIAAALANSHFVQIEDLAGFYGQASLLSRNIGVQIVLRDVHTERQLLNTAFPWGAALPGGGIAIAKSAEQESVRTGRPVLSDVFFGPLLSRYVVNVITPVVSEATARYSLSVGVQTGWFAELVERSNLDPEYVVTVLDQSGTIVTRSHKHDEYSGRRLAPELNLTVQHPASQGVISGANLEGVPFQWYFVRSKQTGWSISVGTPITVLAAPVTGATKRLMAVGGMLALLAVATTYRLGGHLSQSMGRLGVDRAPSRDEFLTLFESAPYGVVVVDTNGRIVLLNARLEAKFGYRREELVGQFVEMLIPVRFRAGHAGLREGFAPNSSVRMMGSGRDLFGLRKDQSEFPIEVGLNPIKTRTEALVMATVVDITARKRSEELLADARAHREDLQRLLISAEENERLRLAHELHDETGQSLTAVMLDLKSIEPFVKEGGHDRFERLRRQLETLGKSLHDVARQLRPTSLDHLGLDASLTNFVFEWSDQFGIEADFHCRCDLDGIGSELATTIYRIVQESLTNIARHAANVTIVSVVVDKIDNELRVTIEDNGIGFDAAQAGTLLRDGTRQGIGIAGMRERLALLGGNLQIESSADAGTTIFARAPVSRPGEIA